MPLIGQILQFPVLPGMDRMIEDVHQNFPLHLRVAGPPEGIAHGVIDEHRAGRKHLHGEVPPCGYKHGGNARLLYHPRNQTDRLMIEGSAGHQNQQIHTVLQQGSGEGRCGFFHHQGTFIDAPHESAPEP